MKVKETLGVEMKGTSLSSSTMGKKSREKKDKININAVKNIELNQVKCNEKQSEDFFAKQQNIKDNIHMKIDEYDSDDSETDTIVQNETNEMNMDVGNVSTDNTKPKMADNGKFSTGSDNKMAGLDELYKHTDKGPYYVICERKEIDEFKLCDLMMKFKIKDIVNVNKITKDKVRILTKSYTSANSLIKMGRFDAFRKYTFFVPNNFVFTEGIVRNIPLYYDPDDLLEIINSKVPITKIERLNFWNQSTKTSQPSTSLKITFRSATVPDNISFMWLLRKVDLFVQKPLFCVLCLKYGHFKKYCDAEKQNPLCRICAKTPHNTEIKCTPTCKQCKTDHLTADKNCPAYKYQWDIKKIMTLKKITYKEAKETKVRENPTPANANNYKKSYSDIVSTGQATSAPGTNHSQMSTNITNTTVDNSKEKNLIITLTKMIEEMAKPNTPGNNDELLINIGKHIQDFWKVTMPPQPSTHNGPN